jgi:hypothetical protein
MPQGYGRAEWQRARARALERGKGRCAWCFATEVLVVHHVDGRGPDGARAFDQRNLIVLCRRCHASTHAAKLAAARADRVRWPPTPD